MPAHKSLGWDLLGPNILLSFAGELSSKEGHPPHRVLPVSHNAGDLHMREMVADLQCTGIVEMRNLTFAEYMKSP